MADLDNLGYKSITEMSTDESLELLRQIRLSRRTPVKTTKKKKTAVRYKIKDISQDLAAEILKTLTGG